MPFTYLDLHAEDDRILATVSKESKVRSVGTENSRWSRGPFATFAIDGFQGIDVISTDDLVEELLERMTAQQLMERLAYAFSTDDLMTMLRKRTK